MNKIKRLCVAIFCVSVIASCCSTPINKDENETYDREFAKYVELFKKDMGSKIRPDSFRKVTIRFGDLEDSKTGLCEFIPIWGHSIITIDRQFWKNKDEYKKKELMYHEFGHCICGIAHTWEYGAYPEADGSTKPSGNESEGFFLDGCPQSMMFPYELDTDCVIKHWEEYKKDIYNRCYP